MKGGARAVFRADEEKRWISVDDRLPTVDDADEHGCVLVWHVFQETMIFRWHTLVTPRTIRPNGRMGAPIITHWRRTPPPDDAAWIETLDRLPTREDEDVLGCVLAFSAFDGILIRGTHAFMQEEPVYVNGHPFRCAPPISKWQRMPPPPPNRAKRWP